MLNHLLKNSAGKSSLSQALSVVSISTTAPFPLKTIAIASALTLGSLLFMTGSPAFAALIDGQDGTRTAAGAGGLGVDGGGNGGAGGFYGAIPGGGGGGGGGGGNAFAGAGGQAVYPNGDGGGGGLTGVSGTSGSVSGIYSLGGGGGGGGVGLFVTNSSPTTNGSYIRAGNGGAGGAGYYVGANGGDGGTGLYGNNFSLTNSSSIFAGVGGAGGLIIMWGYGGSGGSGGAGVSGSEFTITNSASISGGAGGAGGYGYYGGSAGSGGAGVSGSGFTITNSATISGGAGGAGGAGKNGYYGNGGAGAVGGAGVSGSGFSLTNSGTINGGAGGNGGDSYFDYRDAGGAGGAGGAGVSGSGFTLTNSGTINGGAGGYGRDGQVFPGGAGVKVLSGSGTSITNIASGTIGDIIGILNEGTLQLTNAGTIAGLVAAIENTGTILDLTNTGGIFGWDGSAGIVNQSGSIVTLNNLQGEGNIYVPLNYMGALPTNYNIIINSPTSYGQLAVMSGTGSMNFNIYGYDGQTLTSSLVPSLVISNQLYENVLSGLTGSLSGSTITGTSFTVAGATGNYGGYSYTLVADNGNVDGVWDLLLGSCIVCRSLPDPKDTQDSLNKSALELRGAYVLQSAAINYNLNNDCNLFDKHGICTSVTGSQTYVGGGLGNDRTNGTLTMAYRVNDQIRIGGYLDQTLNTGNSSNVHISNGSPAFGAFAVWNANADGLGLQVRASAGYADRDMTVTRQVIGFSEPGTGKTGLDTFGAALVGSYAMTMKNNITISPYVGIRYTKINADAYTETGSDSVTAPLTYSALTQQLTTAMFGTKVSKPLGERTVAYGSIGLEQDLSHNDGTYSATGLDGLTPIAFNGNSNRTRTTASVGAYYNIGERQRIAANLVWSEQSFTSINATSLMATYTHGF